MIGSKPPLRVLIVEDEAIIAMDIEMIVADAGHHLVGEATSFGEVEDFEDELDPDLAFVDVQLAKCSSGIDVSRLICRRWPATVIVFVTANPSKLPADYAEADGVMAKPFSFNGFKSAMGYLEEGVRDPPPASSRPDSLIPSAKMRARWDA